MTVKSEAGHVSEPVFIDRRVSDGRNCVFGEPSQPHPSFIKAFFNQTARPQSSIFESNRALATFGGHVRSASAFGPQENMLNLLGKSQKTTTERHGSSPTFGQAQEPLLGFDHPVLYRADLPKSRDRTLEDLYNAHPEKRLRGIEPETLGLAAEIVQQVADEAASDWLRSRCPGTKWSGKEVSARPLCDFNSSIVDYAKLHHAISLQETKVTVSHLIREARAKFHHTGKLTLLTLIHMIDYCIAVCQVVDDQNRKTQLERTKEKIQWLPVGLDCKKLDIQRRASQKLDEHNGRLRRSFGWSAQDDIGSAKIHQEEQDILDAALVEFQVHRLEFLVELLRTLRQLLQATT